MNNLAVSTREIDHWGDICCKGVTRQRMRLGILPIFFKRDLQIIRDGCLKELWDEK